MLPPLHYYSHPTSHHIPILGQQRLKLHLGSLISSSFGLSLLPFSFLSKTLGGNKVFAVPGQMASLDL
eukprot:912540-Prorocentrum_lima.AAC.1